MILRTPIIPPGWTIVTSKNGSLVTLRVTSTYAGSTGLVNTPTGSRYQSSDFEAKPRWIGKVQWGINVIMRYNYRRRDDWQSSSLNTAVVPTSFDTKFGSLKHEKRVRPIDTRNAETSELPDEQDMETPHFLDTSDVLYGCPIPVEAPIEEEE